GALSLLASRGAADIDKAAKSARRIGASVGAFRAVELVAEEAGVAVEVMTDAVQIMGRELAKGSKGATTALKSLGLSAKDLTGLEVDQKLALIADRIKKLGLSSGKATALLQALGIRNREVLLALVSGGQAFRDARRD